jgi:hypothetical protein
MMADLGIDCQVEDLAGLQGQLNQILLREWNAGRRVVLVIDEGQNLDDSVLETVRMLSNFETPQAKLMQIVIAGQPQLARRLASGSLIQLRQRVSILSRLKPFAAAETADYIDHRLRVAGYKGKPLLTSEALAIIASHSEGIPRNINNLCFHALTLGFASRQQSIDLPIMEEVLVDLDVESLGRYSDPLERAISDVLPEPRVPSYRVTVSLPKSLTIPSVAPKWSPVSRPAVSQARVRTPVSRPAFSQAKVRWAFDTATSFSPSSALNSEETPPRPYRIGWVRDELWALGTTAAAIVTWLVLFGLVVKLYT